MVVLLALVCCALIFASESAVKRKPEVTVTVIRDSEACEFAHNVIRRDWHNTAELEWDDDLAYEAEKWAIHLALMNTNLQHSGQPPGNFIDENNQRYGENVYLMEGDVSQRCSNAVLYWYMERKSTNYDFENIRYNIYAGHMQQLLWIPTTKVGVGITTAFGKTWIVAQYKPPGNSQTTNLNQFIKKPVRAGYPTLSDLTPSSNSAEVKIVLNLPPLSSEPVVDGGWTEWAKASECSENCQRQETRYCINPAPNGNGKDCVGNKIRYRDCSDCDCSDVRDDCEQYRRAGYCETTKQWAEINCRKTCGFCGTLTLPEPDCKDYDSSCSSFANQGYCTSSGYITWMKANCLKACHFC